MSASASAHAVAEDGAVGRVDRAAIRDATADDIPLVDELAVSPLSAPVVSLWPGTIVVVERVPRRRRREDGDEDEKVVDELVELADAGGTTSK